MKRKPPNDPMIAEWSGTIYGEPASKANSRRLVMNRKTGRPMFVKSQKALNYLSSLLRQIPLREPLMAGELAVTLHIYYASHRPDLDESLILDGLQDRIYENDRQVREKHVYHCIDKQNPRTEILIRQRSLPLFAASDA